MALTADERGVAMPAASKQSSTKRKNGACELKFTTEGGWQPVASRYVWRRQVTNHSSAALVFRPGPAAVGFHNLATNDFDGAPLGRFRPGAILPPHRRIEIKSRTASWRRVTERSSSLVGMLMSFASRDPKHSRTRW